MISWSLSTIAARSYIPRALKQLRAMAANIVGWKIIEAICGGMPFVTMPRASSDSATLAARLEKLKSAENVIS
jgi:hypothetical protein